MRTVGPRHAHRPAHPARPAVGRRRLVAALLSAVLALAAGPLSAFALTEDPGGDAGDPDEAVAETLAVQSGGEEATDPGTGDGTDGTAGSEAATADAQDSDTAETTEGSGTGASSDDGGAPATPSGSEGTDDAAVTARRGAEEPARTESNLSHTTAGRPIQPAAVGLPNVDPENDQAELRVRAGGWRTGSGNASQSVTALAGVTYEFYRTGSQGEVTGGTLVGECTTDANGVCGAIVDLQGSGDNYFYGEATDAPVGWTYPTSWQDPGDPSDNYRFTTGGIDSGGSVASRTTTLPRPFDGPVTEPVWANVKDNNTAPPQCGVDLGMVIDLSNSVTDDSGLLQQYKTAAQEFIHALTGTPSRISIMTFATNAPAGGPTNDTLPLTSVATPGSASAVTAKIQGLADTPTDDEGGTNWDRGFAQVTETGESYDAVMFLTDGSPTFYRNGQGPGSSTTIREVNEAIHSANAVKAMPNAPLVIAVGIGPLAVFPQAANRLSLISGPTEGQDFFRSDFDGLADLLNELATSSCGGSLTVVKQLVDAEGTVIDDSPAGWDFTATTSDPVLEADGGALVDTLTRPTDDETGAVNFGIDFGGSTTTARPVTIAETAQPGYELTPQDGANAVCTADGLPVPVTDVGAEGFTVDVDPAAVVSCVVTNRQAYDDLTVTKDTTTSFHRDYDWAIEKTATPDRLEVPAGTDGTFSYEVAVTPSAPIDTDFSVSGTITVTNPNPVAVSGVDVTDALPGATCSVTNGTNLTIAASSSFTVAYECDIPGANAETAGLNTATATWDPEALPGSSGTAEGTAPFDFADATVNVTDQQVVVTDSEIDLSDYDDGFQFGNEVDATQGPTTFTYDITWPSTAGQCVQFENTATITNAAGTNFAAVDVEPMTVSDSSSEVVTLCAGMDLTVSKNVTHSFDRSFLWTIDKEAAETNVTADPATGEATFGYTVTATPVLPPAGSVDSNWAMSGTITVENPNEWLDITADVTDTVDVGGGAVCTVDGGTDVLVIGGAEVDLDYMCTFTSQPGYSGTNTATASWSDTLPTPNTSASGTAEVAADNWSMTPINDTITVTDDKTDPASPVELGTAVWNNAGTATTFTYSITKTIDAGTCETFDNIATITETGQSADETVQACRTAPVTVTKTADASFDRTYLWQVDKSAGSTSVTVDEATGEADFTYTVLAIPDGFADSGWTVDGQITVTNPNDFEPVTVTVTDAIDVGGDAVCTVENGVDVEIAASGEAVFDYSCTFTSEPTYTGTNTATVTVDGEAVTGTADVDFVLDGETDFTVPVRDDKTDPANPVDLGEATWNADGTATPFTYTLTHTGVPATCTDFTNTAWIVVTGDDPTDSATAEVCVRGAVDVSKTADASYDRTYHWNIDKAVDRTSVTVDSATGQADFDYTVTAIQDGFTDSGWTLTGEITVTNPNDFAAVSVDVTDAVDVAGGAVCTVAGGEDVLIGIGETVTLDYSCTFTGQPNYTGTNTATATMLDGATAQGTADVAFTLDAETDKTVDVVDDQTDPANPVTLGQATWDEPSTQTYDYTLTHTGVPGQCVDFTNTAWVVVTGDDPTDEQTVTVCVEAELLVTKTAEATFDRAYAWDVTKDVDETSIEVAGTAATFNYVVDAVPGDFTDSNWEVTGEISVTNPNVFTEAVVTVTDQIDVGGGANCTVAGGEDATIDAGDTRVFDYSCTFESEPDYTGTNTAFVAMGDVVFPATADVDFTVDDETDLVADVLDDKTDPANPVVLGQATWNADGTPIPFTYSLTLEGVAGECTDFTNTAWLAGSSQEAQQTVTVCVEDDLTVVKTADASFYRTYEWDITKDVDDTDIVVDENGRATYTYTVDAVPDGYTDYGWQLRGTITVHNPNSYAGGAITADVVDVNDVGALCSVDGGTDVTLEPGQTVTLDYTCSIEGQPEYEGTNTATVTWTDADGEADSASYTAPVEFELLHETNKTVPVMDDKTDPAHQVQLGEATWDEPDSQTFTYDVTHQGVGGACLPFTNTAWLVLADGGPDASTTVNLCIDSPLTHSKTAVSANQQADGSWLVAYDIDVVNAAAFESVYDLSDTLEFGAGITPTTASWNLTGSAEGGVWSDLPGDVSTVIATDRPIAAHTTETYRVVVEADVAAGVIGSEPGQCSGADGTDGGGFLNAATITLGDESQTDRACLTPEGPETGKTAGSLADNGDGTWTATYQLTATNPSSDQDMSYTLTDELDFTGGVQIVSADVAGAAGAPTANGDWDGVADTNVVSGVILPAGQTDTFDVTVVVDLTGVIAVADLECDAATGGGAGLLNGSTLTSGNDDYNADACLDIPTPEVSVGKTVTSVTQLTDGTWDVTYDVVATNLSTVGTSASVTDALTYGAGIVVLDASVSGPSANAAWDGVAETLVAGAVPLTGSAVLTYQVRVNAQVTAGASATDRACELIVGEDGTGFLNTATLTVAGADQTATACATPVSPTIAKSYVADSLQPVTTPGEVWDGTWTVAYDVTVTNPSDDTPLTYALDDLVDEDLADVIGGTVTGGQLTADVTWTGGNGVTIVDEPVTLAGGAADVYTVTATLTLVPDAPLACDGIAGVINSATVTSGEDSFTDADCAPLPELPTLTLVKSVTDEFGDDVSDELASNWVLTGTETTGIVDPVTGAGGASATVLPGTYGLAENADDIHYQVGWSASDWTCTDGQEPLGLNDDGQVELDYGTDAVCEIVNTQLPIDVDVSKDAGTTVLGDDGTYDVTYTVTATNNAEATDTLYDVTDTFGFSSDIDITGVSVEGPAGIALNDGFDGVSDTTIATDALIPADSSQVYTITVSVDLSEISDAARGECMPDVGLFNAAVLTAGTHEASDDACGEIPNPVVEVTKDVTSLTQQAGGTWAITYEVHATNSSSVGTSALVTDALTYGGGIVVLDQSVSGPGANPDWDGAGDQTIADGVPLPGNSSLTYVVSATAQVTTEASAGDRDCELAEGEDGTGFLNRATVGSAGEDHEATACAAPVSPIVAKIYEEGSATPVTAPGTVWDGTWELAYEIAVSNPSETTALRYSLEDAVDDVYADVLGGTVTGGQLTGDITWADATGTVIVPGDASVELAAGASDTYTVTVQVRLTGEVDPGQFTCTDGDGLINTAIVTSGDDTFTASDCATTPPLPTITLVKTALDPAGQDVSEEFADRWQLTATSVDGTSEPVTGAGAASATVLPGDYALAEAPVAGFDETGWDRGAWICTAPMNEEPTGPRIFAAPADADDAADAGEAVPVAVTDGTVSVAYGDDVTCVVTNAQFTINLAIAKDHGGGDTFLPGDTVTYDLDVSNTEDRDATGVVVRDRIPEHLAVDLDSVALPDGWSVTLQGASAGGYGGDLVFMYADTFVAGTTATLTYSATVAADAPVGELVNVAEVTGNEPEPDDSDNQASDEITVHHPVIPTIPETGFGSPLAPVLALLLIGTGVAVIRIRRTRQA